MYSGQRAMKSSEWITYRTRFLVKAKKLSSSLSFVDALGRQHSGRKGDYLVESSDGVISITPRQIFEDVYVPILSGGRKQIAENPTGDSVIARTSEAVRRKLPQSCRDRRAPAARLGLM